VQLTDNVDEGILNFFRNVVKSRYAGKITDIEIDSLAMQAYNQFSVYLVNEFKTKVGFDSAHVAKLKQLHNATGEVDKESMLDYLAILTQDRSKETLDKLLTDILNSFVESFF
jgi:hypothetical protein